jgi:hypothetical protein
MKSTSQKPQSPASPADPVAGRRARLTPAEIESIENVFRALGLAIPMVPEGASRKRCGCAAAHVEPIGVIISRR